MSTVHELTSKSTTEAAVPAPGDITSVDKILFMKKIAADKRLNLTDTRCAIFVADYYRATWGYGFCTYQRIADDVGISRRNAIAAMGRLVAFGHFRYEKGHSNRANRY